MQFIYHCKLDSTFLASWQGLNKSQNRPVLCTQFLLVTRTCMLYTHPLSSLLPLCMLYCHSCTFCLHVFDVCLQNNNSAITAIFVSYSRIHYIKPTLIYIFLYWCYWRYFITQKRAILCTTSLLIWCQHYGYY